MRKKEYSKPLKRIQKSPVTCLLWLGAPLILFSLLVLLHSIETSTPLTAARANYLGKLLEYPVAATMVLTVGGVLLHRLKHKYY